MINNSRLNKAIKEKQHLAEATKVAITLIEKSYDRLEIVAALANVSVQCLVSLKNCDAAVIDRALARTMKKVLEACQLLASGRKFKLSPESAVAAAYSLLSYAELKRRSPKQKDALKYAAKTLISFK